jgi:hypothetical protein
MPVIPISRLSAPQRRMTLQHIKECLNAMRIHFDSGNVAFLDQRTVSLTRHRAIRLHCLAGTLWVTQDAAPADIVLHAGETRLLGESRQTVIGPAADENVSFSLCPLAVPAAALHAGGHVPIEVYVRRARRLQQQAMWCVAAGLAHRLWRAAGGVLRAGRRGP